MQEIQTDLAPGAIGTYSQAIKSGPMVFLSGQIPLCPKTMVLCSEEIGAQINQVFSNLKAVCEAAGGSLAHLVKINIYLTDLTHFPKVNEIMGEYFVKPYPARAVVEVSALPKGSQVEVDGIMVCSSI